MSEEAKVWYYLQDGQPQGPVTEAQLRDAGIGPDALVWTPAIAKWVPQHLVLGGGIQVSTGTIPPALADHRTVTIHYSTLCLLALLFGGIGLHKFYTRNWAWGVAYVLLCWTYIPLVVSLIEFVRYLTLSPEQVEARFQQVRENPLGFL